MRGEMKNGIIQIRSNNTCRSLRNTPTPPLTFTTAPISMPLKFTVRPVAVNPTGNDRGLVAAALTSAGTRSSVSVSPIAGAGA